MFLIVFLVDKATFAVIRPSLIWISTNVLKDNIVLMLSDLYCLLSTVPMAPTMTKEERET